ncbi:uncharacterized protein LOC110172651 isoform X2 [Boleophthalmus pectinirostris]|uniref:uncharacterized protein LOC110172651 isoform X2 n=1 Tax=Boleophthalmus pectinirostris TaxID=150288 RepID=UPI00242E05C1|nr:uncharacterized protein LOC110172651 isoform X2 [Boleophthalmus pectinirostris]
MLFGVMKTKLWIIQLASLQLWVRLSASQLSPPPPPFPTLNLKSRSTDSAVLVCRAPGGHKGLQFALYRERVKVNSIDVPHGAEEVRFTVRPSDASQRELYCCLYKTMDRYSGFSPYLEINWQRDLLPTPTLILDKQSDVWHLLCRGSPAYPGAGFSLYLQGHDLPVESYQAKLTEHRAIFSVPVQDTPVALYQCEYRVLLGRQWSQSERSLPLSMSQGNSSAPTADSFGVDWPLVLGSLSAVVLFLCSLALLIVMLHRKMKAAADAKKKREEAQFWTQVHGKDHIVDLTLPRQSFTSQDWTNGHTDSAQTSHLWNPLSTFTTPVIPSY